MKIVSPLGEYPFVFDRLERRNGGIDVVGSVAGIESRVSLGSDDLRAAARFAGPPLLAALATATLLGYAAARR
ncbi:MAG TPA: hypothetical protein VMT37_12705 [Solirubrobacterales bacterium]|nr:hypothetical protein [Solirubrobacterales bacterium]